MSIKKIISAVVMLIGAYMIAMYISTGFLVPPVLSGIAFVLIGIQTCVKR